MVSLLFLFLTFASAADDTYVFEAKGEFAKELKSLVEKYSKEGKIEAKVYNKKDLKQPESINTTQTILSVFTDNTAEELKFADIDKGKLLYQKSCYLCHVQNASENKYASSRKLTTLKPLKIVELLEGYQKNYSGNFGGSARYIMKPQADNLTGEEMQSIAVYIYSLNHESKLPSTSEESTQTVDNDEKPSSYLQ
jgi:cytochrome c553